MSSNDNLSNRNYINLLIGEWDTVSHSEETAKQFMKQEGLNYDEIKAEGIKRLKRLRLQLNAEKKLASDNALNHLLEKAKSLVNDLMSDTRFSFRNFLSENDLVLHNRNIESFTKEDIRNTLEKYYYLKLVEDNKKQD
tara:strand:+ start:17144 stop:17557 length:414 start_codon:yes stop_codon:yes gene_type:complete